MPLHARLGLLLFASFFLLQSNPAHAARVTVDVGPLGISINAAGIAFVQPGLFRNDFSKPIIWESTQAEPSVFHVRIPGIPDRFLKLDRTNRKITEVTGGSFGKPGGNEVQLKNTFYHEPGPMEQAFFQFGFQIMPGTLAYDTESHDVSLSFAGYRVMGPAELEVVEPDEGILHVRVRGAQDPKLKEDRFWKIDMKRRLLTSVSSGRFGQESFNEVTITAKVTVDDPRAAELPVPNIHEDLGMAGYKKEFIRESPWFAADKEPALELLKSGRYDLLVVPVQVQDNGFDHIERMLMTRELIRALRAATDRSIPDPDLVERALGWGLRTWTEQSTLKLANMLGCRTVVRVYAGHGRDLKLRLTLVQQERTGNESFDSLSHRKETVFADIPYSDERLPVDALVEKMPAVLAALGFTAVKEPSIKDTAGLQKLPVPASPLDAVQTADRSPLVQAASLSVMGAFSPQGSLTADRFFQRALTMLRTVPQRSPEGRFLKAYALVNLYRRPAALEVLGKPSTPELAALRTYLDGSLTTLPAEVGKIKTPVSKVLMQVAMNDLVWEYDPQTARTRSKSIVKELPKGWMLIGERRLTQRDVWIVPPTIDLKKYLDETVPVHGFALQDIVRNMAVRGDLGSGDAIAIDASVHEHRKRLLTEHAAEYLPAADSGLARVDLLELAAAWAENGWEKHARLRAWTQGLYEEAIALVDKYETVFRGHPELLSYKASALRGLARRKQGDERRNLERMADEINRDVCLWSGGQTPTSYYSCTSSMVFFENDFPRKPFWGVPRDQSLYGDRVEYRLREIVVTSPETTIPLFAEMHRSELKHRELAYRYGLSDARVLEHYHEALLRANMQPEAEMLVERGKQRFAGSPRKAAFLAKLLEQKGDEQAVVKLYEETVRTVPGVWEPYFELGSAHLRNGDVKKAVSSFRQYPFFRAGNSSGDDEDTDTVALSNDAYEAGKDLRWAGAAKEAREFFALSARYDTGSSRCMWSSHLLSLYDRDYNKAGQLALANGQRYGNKNAFGSYLHIQRVTTQAPETDSLFLSLNLMNTEIVPWEPVIAGLRMDEKGDDDIRAWLAMKGRNIVGRTQARRFYVYAFLEDRKATAGLSDMIENIEKQVELPERQRQPMRTVDQDRKPVLSVPALYAAVRYAIEQKQYDQAVTLLNQWTRVIRSSEESKSPFLEPYVTWAYLKVGDRANAERLHTVTRTRRGKTFEYWLAKAMLDASVGRHNDALRSLDLARYNVNSSLHDTRLISAWYHLVETCELLFEDTGNAGYRDRAVELAQLREEMAPLTSWAYAVQAKYAPPGEERLRPLGIALYLDPRSMHLDGIPEQEKANARKWLATNNPFQQKMPSPRNQVKAPAGVVVAGR